MEEGGTMRQEVKSWIYQTACGCMRVEHPNRDELIAMSTLVIQTWIALHRVRYELEKLDDHTFRLGCFREAIAVSAFTLIQKVLDTLGKVR